MKKEIKEKEIAIMDFQSGTITLNTMKEGESEEDYINSNSCEWISAENIVVQDFRKDKNSIV
jgi:hypothetical protein|tara:strand:- start:1773 stop:1958 length:186 start_codon:yes stop_codon:yes gene_type:complete